MKKVRVLLVGSAGRMGRAIVDLAKEGPKIDVVAQCDLGDSIERAMSDSNVIIDFSHADAIDEICGAAVKHRQALVIGTTGHSSEQRGKIETAAQTVPIVFASNFSIGVNALFSLTRKAAELLGGDFDLEIVEMHHRMKKDAPSGTAKTLAEILKEVRKLKNIRHGREGIVDLRPEDEIGIHSIRGGDAVGDHTVIFAGSGERLELTHRASSRETFARGALRAAQWIVGKSPGLYTMGDVLGL